MSRNFHPAGLPGVKSEISSIARKVFLADDRLLPGGIIIDGSNSRDSGNTNDLDILRHGMVMGQVTSNGRYAPFAFGTISQAYDEDASSVSSHTQLVTSADTASIIQTVIGSSGTINVTGPPSAGGTVATETFTYTAVDTSTGVLTVNDQSVNFVSGSWLQPTNGAQTPLGILWHPQSAGYKVTDQDDNSVDVPAQLAIGGHVDASQLIFWPSDSSMQTYLKSLLNGGSGTNNIRGQFTFGEDFAHA